MGRAVLAGVPALLPVDTGTAPLKLSAPDGWAIHLQPPRNKEMSMIATASADCRGGPDVTVMIQLDRTSPSPAALLKDQYKNAKPSTVNGWDCVVVPANTEAMCAGRVKGLSGVVSVYFATTDARPFQALGAGDLAAQMGASLRWTGGAPESIKDWRRDAGPAPRDVCKR
ncbi:Hypothetical protein A7982_02406 [Minicystis rosea]|nr:Hypothetical protein A7982_02406 [Minicystis rosea]